MKKRLRSHVAAARVARGLAMALVATSGVVVLASACASKTTSVGPGGECFLATDCAPGLICIEQADKTRICSDDLSRVRGEPPSAGGSDDAGGDGAIPEASVGDVVTPPPEDTGAPDTGMPPPDSGPPPVDAGDGGG